MTKLMATTIPAYRLTKKQTFVTMERRCIAKRYAEKMEMTVSQPTTDMAIVAHTMIAVEEGMLDDASGTEPIGGTFSSMPVKDGVDAMSGGGLRCVGGKVKIADEHGS